MDSSHDFFTHWYLGALLAIWGVWLIVRAKTMNDIRDNFDDDPRPELKAVADRRQQLEARPLAAWYIAGASDIALGVAALLQVVSGGLAYALACVVIVSLLTAGYVRMRNSGPRRAAALVPRRIGSLIAWPWYPLGVLMALSPLVFLDVPAQRVAAILVVFCSFAIMALALRTNGMPALLTGENVDLELYVDDCLRTWRVNGFWTISMAVPFVFVAFAGASTSPDVTLLQVIAFYVGFVVVVARYLIRKWSDIAGAMRKLVRGAQKI